MDDLQAIQRLKSGDISGLEVLVTRYQVKAVRVAYLIIHDEAQAKDVFQEVCLRIYQRIHQFDETRPFEPFLMSSVVHAALNLAQRDRKLVPLEQDTQQFETLMTQAASVESQVESAQLTQEILSALSRLTPRQRAVIVQRYYLEMSEKEMAETLMAAPGTIKWHLNTARDRMRRLLRPERSGE